MKTSPRAFLLNLKFWLLPFLAACFPPLFHYGNNADILLAFSLVRWLLVSTLFSLLLFFMLLVFIKQPAAAALVAFILLIFFHTYGVLYDALLRADFFQVEHFSLLPVYLLLSFYAVRLLGSRSPASSLTLWNGITLVVSVLVVFNLVRILSAEFEKKAARDLLASTAMTTGNARQDDPDIYFIILDEMSGFEPMRRYWRNPRVDEFVQALQSRGFYIIENSHSSSIRSLHQMAERLNYEQIPNERGFAVYFSYIDDSRVMRYLKARGYTTVVMEELSSDSAFGSMPPILADYTFPATAARAMQVGDFFDEYGLLLADNSMLRVLSRVYRSNSSSLEEHRQMISFVLDKVGSLEEVPAPRFVYVHLMLPHKPFMFDAKGREIPPKFRANWNYYEGQYNYTMQLVLEMVDSILAGADPQRPPVIILQSDHGARNLYNAGNTITLTDFPEKYKTNIVFALHMPGYDMSQIPQDVKPINTFPIVFNYLFGDEIPLIK